MGPYGLGHMVVMRLTIELKNLGHIVVLDNLFFLVRLFHNLMLRGFWASGTMKVNEKGMLKKLCMFFRV